jgi:hypothetical protein
MITIQPIKLLFLLIVLVQSKNIHTLSSESDQYLTFYPSIVQNFLQNSTNSAYWNDTVQSIYQFNNEPTFDSNGMREYKPKRKPNPGSNSRYPILGQTTILFCDHKRTGIIQTKTDYGILLGFNTSTTHCNGHGPGNYLQWAEMFQYPGDTNALEEYRTRTGHDWPKATMYQSSVGNHGPIPANVCERFSEVMWYLDLPPLPGHKFPPYRYELGYGVIGGAQLRRCTHQAHQGLLCNLPLAVLGDNFLPDDGIFADYPSAITNRTRNKKVVWKTLEKINLPDSGHFLSKHIDLNNSIHSGFSDGASANIALASGSSLFNVLRDPDMAGKLLLNSAGADWEFDKHILKNLNIKEFGYVPGSSFGAEGQIREHYLQQCPIAYLTLIYLAAHRSFMTDSQNWALIVNYTGDIVNSSPQWCEPYTGPNSIFAPTCIALNPSKGLGYPPNTLEFLKFWDDVAINVLMFPSVSPTWMPFMYLPITYLLMGDQSTIIHSKKGNHRWRGANSADKLELRFDQQTSSGYSVNFFINSFDHQHQSSYPSSSSFVPDQLFQDGDFNYTSPLPQPLSEIENVWLPYPPGQQTNCP